MPIDGLDGTTIEIEEEDTSISTIRASMEESLCTLVIKNCLFLKGYVFLYISM
jgi:hypothetical protein